jgi:NAD(P)-dependent dehydrogenase (short-subunit alcohol dehydrogenase family)
MKDKTVLITGANRGIGRQAALELARTGARIWIAGRSRQDAERTRDELIALTGNVSLFATHLDLSSPGSIRACAAMLHREAPVLDVLINNAGMMARARTLTAEGVESPSRRTCLVIICSPASSSICSNGHQHPGSSTLHRISREGWR